jgi:hypothetical protein
MLIPLPTIYPPFWITPPFSGNLKIDFLSADLTLNKVLRVLLQKQHDLQTPMTTFLDVIHNFPPRTRPKTEVNICTQIANRQRHSTLRLHHGKLGLTQRKRTF